MILHNTSRFSDWIVMLFQ